MDAKTRNLLLSLVDGEDGVHQPRRLRGKLLALERAGWIEYQGGWQLTDVARAAIRKAEGR